METLSKFENTEQMPVVEFVYDREKDVTCLLEKGPGGYFNPSPTTAYKALLQYAGEHPTQEQASEFIDIYLKEKGIDISEKIKEYTLESKEILENFKRKAEEVFGIEISEGSKAYLTVNNRCPYNIEENMFYATISEVPKTISISMHELWHFYTWYKFGEKEQDLGEIDSKRYGDIKEALTVLLNPDSLNLLPKGEIDNGYPQHAELRKKIADLWKQNPDIEFVWDSIRKEM
jgi:hypothetical protein